jgi:hypothetical protein
MPIIAALSDGVSGLQQETKIELLTSSEREFLVMLMDESWISLLDALEHLNEACRLVNLGLARLAVVTYPWGLEFRLEISDSGRALAGGRVGPAISGIGA